MAKKKKETIFLFCYKWSGQNKAVSFYIFKESHRGRWGLKIMCLQKANLGPVHGNIREQMWVDKEQFPK